MCGFVGFINQKQEMSPNRDIIKKMNQTLVKRGPDEEGYFLDSHIHMGHKRLIVIDPKGGKQPMLEKTSYGDFVICYNGQIYNTKELKNTLIENGYTLHGHSDTEILLKSYIHYGYDVVKHLNGIFAFAIWNTKTKELFLARDHFGVKPLFYTIQNDTLIFASELKAIFSYPDISRIIDKQGLSEMFGIGPAQFLKIFLKYNLLILQFLILLAYT